MITLVLTLWVSLSYGLPQGLDGTMDGGILDENMNAFVFKDEFEIPVDAEDLEQVQTLQVRS